MKISSEHPHSQTGRARDLKFWENVHLPPSVMCHMSSGTCLVSRVTCHMSHVRCHMLHIILYKKKFCIKKNKNKNAGACQWRVCYQRGLPCLVLKTWKCVFLLWMKVNTTKKLKGVAVNLCGPFQKWSLRTHFQINYTFQSHALRKLILSRLNCKRFFSKSSSVLHTYIKTTEDQISKKVALTQVKYIWYEKKYVYLGLQTSSKYIPLLAIKQDNVIL